jgi:Cu+-exporting ATPase
LTKNTTIKLLCSYCDTECDNDLVKIDNQIYCCYGCATLDDVVSKIKNRTTDVSLKYKQFDLEENFSKLVDYENEEMYKIGISLPSIHCSSCIELLEDLPSFQEGIISARVNFEQRRCTITAKKDIPLSFVAQLLDDIGYPPQISISQKLKEQDKQLVRSNLLKLAVAGFCFGNIMLFSMPHYFGLHLTDDTFFSKLFSGLSVILSIPVLAFSGRDYLTSAYRALAAGKSHLNIPISLGIISLFGWSIYEIFSGTGIGYLDSLAGLIFFLLIGKWFQHKVYDQVSYHRNVQDFIPLVVRNINKPGSFEWARIDSLTKGDNILVKNGEIIPVNGVISTGKGLVDYSFITGESLPEKAAINQKVFAGGCQKLGDIEVTLSETPSIDKLWETWNSKSEQKEFETHWTDHISKYFTISVISIAILSGAYWLYFDPTVAAFVFSSVLIVACPCALALSAPFTYGNILRVFSNNSFYIKSSNAISTLNRLKHIVFDKTGTLTEKQALSVTYIGGVSDLNQELKKGIASLASQSTHPLSQIIANKYSEFSSLEVDEFKEEIGKGISGIVNNNFIRLGSSQWITNFKKETNASSVYVSVNDTVMGHFSISTVYRQGLKDTLNKLSKWYKISLLSGDNSSEKSRLQKLFPNFNKLMFGLKPNQKAAHVQQIKINEAVMMIGDGLNDSSAIQEGDFGISVTDNLNGFYPGADGVLLSESFTKLPKFMELARYSKRVLQISLVFSLMYNITGVAFAVFGLLTPIIAAVLMPISSVSVVLLDTLLIRYKAKKIKLI